MVLEPLDSVNIVRGKKKRRGLIIDDEIFISNEKFIAQKANVKATMRVQVRMKKCKLS